MRTKCFIAIAVLSLAIGSALAETVAIHDLFEVETTNHGRLEGYGVAIDVESLLASNKAPSAVELSRFLQLVKNQIDSDESSPAWLNDEHLIPVIVRGVVPAGGCRRGDRVDCSVMSLSGQSTKGMVLMETVVFAHEENVATAVGRINEDQQVSAGLLITAELDDLPRQQDFRVGNRTQIWYSFRIRENYEGHDRLQLLVNAKVRVSNELQGYFRTQDSSVAEEVCRIVSTNRLLVRLPSTYYDDPMAFLCAVNKMVISPPVTAVSVKKASFKLPAE